MAEVPPFEGEPFPEMLAVANIIDRIRAYVAKHDSKIRMSIVMDFASTEKGIMQNFIVTAVPSNETDDNEFTRVHKDCMGIIREEFEALYPDSTTTITTPVANNVNYKEIDKKLDEKFEEYKKSMKAKLEHELPGPEKPKPGSTFMGFD